MCVSEHVLQVSVYMCVRVIEFADSALLVCVFMAALLFRTTTCAHCARQDHLSSARRLKLVCDEIHFYINHLLFFCFEPAQSKSKCCIPHL